MSCRWLSTNSNKHNLMIYQSTSKQQKYRNSIYKIMTNTKYVGKSLRIAKNKFIRHRITCWNSWIEKRVLRWASVLVLATSDLKNVLCTVSIVSKTLVLTVFHGIAQVKSLGIVCRVENIYCISVFFHYKSIIWWKLKIKIGLASTFYVCWMMI